MTKLDETEPIIERMAAQIRLWQEGEDDRIHFLACYRLMTKNMLTAVAAGEFDDGVWVSELLHHFAGYYFDALTVYEHGDERTPAVWSSAHDVACRCEGNVIENLFLGINAHINYDLVLTVVDMLQDEWPRLTPEQRALRYSDHCRVNDIIARTIDSVQDDVVEPQLWPMAWVDNLLGPLDEWALSRLITHWRDDVWRQAVTLLETASALEREQIVDDIESAVLRRARAILNAGNPAEFAHLL